MNTILDKFKEIYLPRRYQKHRKPYTKTHQLKKYFKNPSKIKKENIFKKMKPQVMNYVKNPMSDYLQQNEPNYSSKNVREKGIFTNMRFMRLETKVNKIKSPFSETQSLPSEIIFKVFGIMMPRMSMLRMKSLPR